MTGNERADYYVNRAVQARDFAARAQSPQARAIHLDLADRYDQLLRYAASNKPLLTVIEGGRRRNCPVAPAQAGAQLLTAATIPNAGDGPPPTRG